MSYNFSSAGNSRILSNATFAGIEYPITMSCWAMLVGTATVTRRTLSLRLRDSGGTLISACIDLGHNNTSNWVAAANYTTTNGTATATSTITENVWYNLVGVFLNNSSRSLWLDGVFQATDTTTVTAGFYENPIIGARRRTTVVDLNFNGKIAEAAVWNDELSQNEIISLSKGIKPLQIRPQKLKYYAPLAGRPHDYKEYVEPSLAGTTIPTVDPLHPRRYG